MSDVFKSADWVREALAKKERPPRQSPFVFEFSPSSTYELLLDYTETRERIRDAFFPPSLYNFGDADDA